MAAVGIAVIAVVVAVPSLLRTEPPPPPPDVGLVQAPPPPPPAPAIAPPPEPQKLAKPARGAKREKGAATNRAGPKPEPARKRPGRANVKDPSPGAEDGSETEASAATPPPVVYVPPPPSRERFGFER